MIPDEIKVVSANYLGSHQLKIAFDDGVYQVIDFSEFLLKSSHPDIKKYQDENLFADFSICDGDLMWHDYELCFPVSDLYQNENIEINDGA